MWTSQLPGVTGAGLVVVFRVTLQGLSGLDLTSQVSGLRFHMAVVDPGWDSFYLYSRGGGQDDGLRSFPP